LNDSVLDRKRKREESDDDDDNDDEKKKKKEDGVCHDRKRQRKEKDEKEEGEVEEEEEEEVVETPDVFFECKTGKNCLYATTYPYDEYGKAVFCRECHDEGFHTCTACEDAIH
jgi:hypothetical protein